MRWNEMSETNQRSSALLAGIGSTGEPLANEGGKQGAEKKSWKWKRVKKKHKGLVTGKR